MTSIRENVFETNSSSCHSLTICKDSIKEKLKSYEALYTGHFENDTSGELYINEIEASGLLDRNQIIKKLQEFRDINLQEIDWQGDYPEDQQRWLKEHDIENMDLAELVNHSEFDLWYVLQILGIDIIHPDTIFGGEKRNTWIRFEKEMLDPVTNEPVTIYLAEMGD